MGDTPVTTTTTDPPPPALDGPTTPPPTVPEPEAEHDEPLGDGGKRALDRERKARRDAEAKLKELEPLAKAAQDKADAEKTELQKTTEALTAERDARAKAETALLRHEVAIEKGVPSKLVRFLMGGTKEEVEASADALLAELGNGDRPAVPTKPAERMATGKPSSSLDGEDPMALIKRARRLDD
jgi:Domain of unknown function (DUF4355)